MLHFSHRFMKIKKHHSSTQGHRRLEFGPWVPGYESLLPAWLLQTSLLPESLPWVPSKANWPLWQPVSKTTPWSPPPDVLALACSLHTKQGWNCIISRMSWKGQKDRMWFARLPHKRHCGFLPTLPGSLALEKPATMPWRHSRNWGLLPVSPC